MRIPVVTALPSSPKHGMEVLFDTGQAGVYWRLKYNANEAGSYKWYYIGGPPMHTYQETSAWTASATWQHTPTSGTQCSITLPLNGDYDVAAATNPTAGTGVMYLGVGIDSTDPVNEVAIQHHSGVNHRTYGRGRLTGRTAGQVAKTKAFSNGTGATHSQTNMDIWPVKVG